MGREQNSAETLTSEPTQACVDTNAPLLSAAFCSAVDSTESVGSEGLGIFGFDGFDNDIKAFAAKHRYMVVTENFVTLQLIRSIDRLTKELANCNNRSNNGKNSENNV
jgi:hypothetical protein